jgi:hypothetical protein
MAIQRCVPCNDGESSLKAMYIDVSEAFRLLEPDCPPEIILAEERIPGVIRR